MSIARQGEEVGQESAAQNGSRVAHRTQPHDLARKSVQHDVARLIHGGCSDEVNGRGPVRWPADADAPNRRTEISPSAAVRERVEKRVHDVHFVHEGT